MDFKAVPIIGSPLEEDFTICRGFLICDIPDPESFLRDLLSEMDLCLDKLKPTTPLTQADFDRLPELLKNHYLQTGHYIVYQGEVQT